MTIRFGSLFSGIGGFDLGLERAGMECAWQVEIEPYCLRVLEKHWAEVKRYGDIKKIEWAEVDPVDLICGGFPCQPFSVAGRRRGGADERNLWPEMLRAVRGVRPRWVLGENVPGIGPYLNTICADLEGEGYEVILLEIPVAAFGAPHLRYRLFIVAHSNRLREPQPQGGKSDEWRRLGGGGTDVAHANGKHGEWGREPRSPDSAGGQTWTESKGRSEDVAHADGPRCETGGPPLPSEREKEPTLSGDAGQRCGGDAWWAIEPDVGRVAHGVPHRVDRLRILGNAVVPQVVQWIGEQIVNAEGPLTSLRGAV